MNPPPLEPSRVEPLPDLEGLGFDFDTPGDEWLDRLRLAETPLPLGSIGPYELIDEVSRGGQGVVFRARQPGTNREIALKRMLAGSFSTPSMRLRFAREIEAAAALNHPNIITVYGMEEVDGQPVFAMEWIEGVPVTHWSLRGEEPLSDALAGGSVPRNDPRDTMEVFLRVCDAIQHAHSRGVLHRDLKPSNILVDRQGQPHVLDFGMAKHLAQEENGAAAITRSTDFLGTPAYASPEQLHGGGDLDERADIYSLGVILFEMLTGRSPYGEVRSVHDILRAVESGEVPRPSSLDPRLGREVDTIALMALARDPDERYASVAALAADIRRYLVGEPILAVAPSSWYLLKKLVQRNKLATVFVATVLLFAVGFGIFAQSKADELTDKNSELFDKNLELEKSLRNEEQMSHRLMQLRGFSPDSILRRADLNPDYVRLRPKPEDNADNGPD